MPPVRALDFARLSLMDALDLAVLIEEEARDRYEELADQMQLHRTFEAERFFRFMSGNEEKHRYELSARRRERFGTAKPRVDRSLLFDVEAPEYDAARAFMSAREALQVALRCEEKAHAFFAAALPQLQDVEVRALFADLCREEVAHQDLVKRELSRLPDDPPVRGDDVADDPVAQ